MDTPQLCLGLRFMFLLRTVQWTMNECWRRGFTCRNVPDGGRCQNEHKSGDLGAHQINLRGFSPFKYEIPVDICLANDKKMFGVIGNHYHVESSRGARSLVLINSNGHTDHESQPR
jgi:hypothetical protein